MSMRSKSNKVSNPMWGMKLTATLLALVAYTYELEREEENYRLSSISHAMSRAS